MTTYVLPQQNEITAGIYGDYLLITEKHEDKTESVIRISMSSVEPLCRALGNLKAEFQKTEE